MDLYDDSRTLVYSGPLARKQRSEMDWHGWNDYFVALLDNFREIFRPLSLTKFLTVVYSCSDAGRNALGASIQTTCWLTSTSPRISSSRIIHRSIRIP